MHQPALIGHCPTSSTPDCVVLTYCGLGDPSHRHSEAQQGVVLVLRKSQQLSYIGEGLGRSIPVQTCCRLAERHSKSSEKVRGQRLLQSSTQLGMVPPRIFT